MKRRYFVTYKRWTGTETETPTIQLGRFYDLESAQREAKSRYDYPGYEILNIRPETEFEATKYKALRFFIRLLRILTGSVLALFAHLWLSDSAPKIGEIPLSQLTLKMIFSSIIDIALSIGAICLCWIIAFGEGPKDDR